MNSLPSLASPYFDDYRANNSARFPDLLHQVFPDEISDLTANDDILDVTVPPQHDIRTGEPSGEYADQQKYLWLVRQENVLLGPEFGPSGLATARKRLSHTNLSGGAEAHAGGELWFKDDCSIVMNGGSSRYEPRSAEELRALAVGFVTAGYRVRCAEWNVDLDRPDRIFRGAEPWL